MAPWEGGEGRGQEGRERRGGEGPERRQAGNTVKGMAIEASEKETYWGFQVETGICIAQDCCLC